MTFDDLELLWQIDPDDPVVAALGDLVGGHIDQMPDLPRTVSPHRGWFRPPTSVRTIYARLPSRAATSDRGGVLAVKGSEPLADDFAQLPQAMMHRSFRAAVDRGYTSMLEHFPLRERKVPAAFTHGEARAEIESASSVQRDHLAAFGTLAPLPVPLRLVAIPQDRHDHVSATLAPLLSPAARAAVDELLREPLVVLLSFHSGSPERVSTLDRALSDAEAQRALEGWIGLTARLLALGYLPHTFQSEGLGSCLDPGNACIDGSVCDPDSIRPIADLVHLDDGAVYDAISSSFLAVVRLAGLISPGTVEWSTGHDLMRAYVRRRFTYHLERARAHVEPDPRVTAFFDDHDHQTVLEMLRSRRRSTGQMW